MSDFLQGLIGKTEEEANLWLAETKPKNGETEVTCVRAMTVDGEGMMGTMDYREDRANVVTVDGKITEVQGCS
jgi:hypothetical protein